MEIENRRILILDDEPEIRSGYRNVLLPQKNPSILSSRLEAPLEAPLSLDPSFELVEANQGMQALEILLEDLKKGLHFAGAFVDVRMPGQLDGLGFIREAWKQDPDLNVVVVTAYQDR